MAATAHARVFLFMDIARRLAVSPPLPSGPVPLPPLPGAPPVPSPGGSSGPDVPKGRNSPVSSTPPSGWTFYRHIRDGEDEFSEVRRGGAWRIRTSPDILWKMDDPRARPDDQPPMADKTVVRRGHAEDLQPAFALWWRAESARRHGPRLRPSPWSAYAVTRAEPGRSCW